MLKLPRSFCLKCHKVCNRSNAKYCTAKCRAVHFSEIGVHFGGPKNQLVDIECPSCKKKFKPRQRSIKYCSKHCMGLARKDELISMAKARVGPRDLSFESRQRMSIAASNRNNQREYTKGIGGIRQDIGHYVRSTWEANFARILIYLGIQYKFEAIKFSLTIDERPVTYTPDFKVGDKYFEVKGWWNDKAKAIKQAMSEQYPDIDIEYIDEPTYKILQEVYGELNGWECKRRRC